MRYKPFMRMWQTSSVLLIWGLAIGMLLWGTGLDVNFQLWVAHHTPVWLDKFSRFVSDFGLGRNQILACLILGLAIGYKESRQKSLKQPLVWTFGVFHQLYLWFRWNFTWTPYWKNLTNTPRMFLLAIPTFALAGLINILFKYIIGRPRPKEILWNGVSPYHHLPLSDAGFMSFPSGHTATTAAIAIIVAQVLPKRWRWLPYLWIFAVAAARVFSITPHYVGDVVAGAALGIAVARMVLKGMGVKGVR